MVAILMMNLFGIGEDDCALVTRIMNINGNYVDVKIVFKPIFP